jgi:hypothetical protein
VNAYDHISDFCRVAELIKNMRTLLGYVAALHPSLKDVVGCVWGCGGGGGGGGREREEGNNLRGFKHIPVPQLDRKDGGHA